MTIFFRSPAVGLEAHMNLAENISRAGSLDATQFLQIIIYTACPPSAPASSIGGVVRDGVAGLSDAPSLGDVGLFVQVLFAAASTVRSFCLATRRHLR
jgi:hypothetical protein